MKKVFLVILILLGLNTSANVSAKNIKDSEVDFFFKEFQVYEEEWVDAKVKKGDAIFGEDDSEIGYIYRVFDKNIQKGYIIYLNTGGIVEAKFEGNDVASEINGKVYFVYPGKFMSKHDFMIYEDSIVKEEVSETTYKTGAAWYYGINYSTPRIETYNTTTYSIDSDNIVKNLTGNYTKTTYYNAIKGMITNVPDYIGFVTNGCASTAASSLIAYYDNEYHESFSDIDKTRDFRSIYEFDVNDVDNDIVDLNKELAVELGVCSDSSLQNCDGASDTEVAIGMKSYLDSKDLFNYDFLMSSINSGNSAFPTNEFWDYKVLISKGNPAILLIAPGGYVTNEAHAVIGIGYISTMSSVTTGFFIYDNLSHGVSWLSQDHVDYFGFLYKI